MFEYIIFVCLAAALNSLGHSGYSCALYLILRVGDFELLL